MENVLRRKQENLFRASDHSAAGTMGAGLDSNHVRLARLATPLPKRLPVARGQPINGEAT